MKKPASSALQHLEKAGATAKYRMRGVKWTLRFEKNKEAKDAMGLLTKFDKGTRSILMPGTNVNQCQDGLGFTFTWAKEIMGKSLHGMLNILEMSTGGAYQFRDFLLYPMMAVHVNMGSPLLNTSPAGGETANPYPPLPPELATASFDTTNWWDMDRVHAALDEHGFVCLRKFIPSQITQLAMHEATSYLLKVMRSFQHGHAIDEPGLAGFDKLVALPGKVWEHRPNLMTKCITFAKGNVGIEINAQTKVVTKVEPGGQAHKMDVEVGWVWLFPVHDKFHINATISNKLLALVKCHVKPTDPHEKDTTQPLVDIDTLIEEDFEEGDGIIFEFQPPKYYTNFAVEQHWGVATQKGYQQELGIGRVTDPKNFRGCLALMSAQRYMRNWIAQLHQCLPEELHWEAQGVSVKAGSSILTLHMGSPGS